jgi:hypothetical protein
MTNLGPLSGGPAYGVTSTRMWQSCNRFAARPAALPVSNWRAWPSAMGWQTQMVCKLHVHHREYHEFESDIIELKISRQAVRAK